MQSMMQDSYLEMVEDSAVEARGRERQALRRSIDAMRAADASPADQSARTQAIASVNQLWSAMMEDLASPDNDLPAELRASIISIGIFVLRQCDVMRTNPEMGFDGIIEISTVIEEGLA